MLIKKMKLKRLKSLLFTEKINLAVLESGIYKSNSIFYIGENQFIRTDPL